MTQWEYYIECIKPQSNKFGDLISAMREMLEQIEPHSGMGYKFLFSILRDLASEFSWQFGEAVHSTFLEDIPPDTTATYLSEVFSLPFEESAKGKLTDPMTFLFNPIFGVDFPQIYGSLLGNLLYKVWEVDPNAIKRATKKIRESIPMAEH